MRTVTVWTSVISHKISKLPTYRKRKSKSKKNVKNQPIFSVKTSCDTFDNWRALRKDRNSKEKLNFTQWVVVVANRPKMKTWNSIQLLVWFKSIILIRLFVVFAWLNQKFNQANTKYEEPGQNDGFESKAQGVESENEDMKFDPNTGLIQIHHFDSAFHNICLVE